MKNCEVYDINGNCERCLFKASIRTLLINNGTCQTLPLYCQALDNETGKCETCYPSFTLLKEKDQCVRET